MRKLLVPPTLFALAMVACTVQPAGASDVDKYALDRNMLGVDEVQVFEWHPVNAPSVVCVLTVVHDDETALQCFQEDNE